ncbi:hypothetical protein AX15_007888 [Amanita polypyramis BW_CC]|nr:hypothetical protein AX15_007888 [Amanita polypyramis BW_CC]
MKVLIVGAGIGGLSTYIALHKHLLPLVPSLCIRIVEAHAFLSGPKASPLASASTIVGAGLGLAPNGLQAIHSLSPKAAQYIVDRSFMSNQATLRNGSGQTLGVLSAWKKERYGGFGMAMVSRAVVFEGLMGAFGEIGKGDDVEHGRKVVSIKELDMEGVEVEYADGVKEVVDLVIGADGVRSRVRDALFDGKYPAEYTGLMGAGGFIPVSLLPPKLKESVMKEGTGKNDEGVVMTFGPRGFFGYTLCTPRSVPNQHLQHGPILQWWATYEAPEPSYSSMRAKTNAEAENIKQELLKIHGSWESPSDGNSEDESVFRSIIELGCASEEVEDKLSYHHTPVLLLPRYIVPRRLESYVTPSMSGKIILMGDAAHAMPPDAGQGVPCAVEDAVVYSLLLSKLLAREAKSTTGIPENVLQNAALAYDSIRKPRMGKILDMAKNRGDSKKEMSAFNRWLRDLVIRLMCMMPESFHDSLFAYDAENAVEEYLAKVQVVR